MTGKEFKNKYNLSPNHQKAIDSHVNYSNEMYVGVFPSCGAHKVPNFIKKSQEMGKDNITNDFRKSRFYYHKNFPGPAQRPSASKSRS